MKPILEIQLHTQLDASASRQRARQIAAICGFDKQDQTRLAATVSELARSATDRTRPGRITFSIASYGQPAHLVIEVVDHAWHGARWQQDGYDAKRAFDAGMVAARKFTTDVTVDERGGARGIRLSRARPADAPPRDAPDIIDAMLQLDSASGSMALSEAQQHSRTLEAQNSDMTQANSALHAQAEVLMSADRRKDEFLAILAHELRGPLSAVSMAAGMLSLGGCAAGEAAHLGKLIARQSDHMSRIVEDLLDVSRIVRNEVAIEHRPLDLHGVVQAAVEQAQPAADRRGHVIELRLAPQAAVVAGDRTRLVQVLANLIGNAIRYTPEGGRIVVELAAAGPEQVVLSVADNGIGISAELLPNLFDLFKQARRSTDSRNSGLGLGLALVKTLVEAHGGSVRASSPGTGQGSRFEIRLPCS